MASDVGFNSQIISNAEDGFLPHENDNTSWISALSAILKDENLRKTMGENGRKKIQQDYSVNANKDKVMDLFT